MNKVITGVVVLLLAGCATKPTLDELNSADYGAYPYGYKDTISSHMSRRLKDPESARYDYLNQPQKAWNGFGGAKYGYAVCVNVNAKNSFGGYTGGQMSYFLLRGSSVIDSSHGNSEYSAIFVKGLCKSFIN